MALRWFEKKPVQENGRPAPMDVVVNAYRQVLMSHNNPVEDITVLPVPKHMIKQAIAVKYSTITDPSAREALLVAYLMLATYQSLTDAEKEIVASYNRMMKNPPPEKVITPEDKMAVVLFMEIAPAFNSLQSRVFKEHEELTVELRKAGLH